MSGEFYYPEIMPPGVALFDYDNDGDLDVFIVQGRINTKDTKDTKANRITLPTLCPLCPLC
jgi:hypothetical protein